MEKTIDMKQGNLFEKYGITKKEFDEVVDQCVNFGKGINFNAVLALADLIANGNISSQQ